MASSDPLQPQVRTEVPQTGIRTEDSQQLAQGLARALGETYVLYVKTQGFHWNVVGPLFYGLHKLTEEQYEDLADAADKLAERIRALGYPAPNSFKEFARLSAVSEAVGNPSAREMIEQLVKDHETVSRTFRETVALADEAGDVVTADLLTQRIHAHDKAAWMLRAINTQDTPSSPSLSS
jgi:starvation-inducible DNA-binding protein